MSVNSAEKGSYLGTLIFAELSLADAGREAKKHSNRPLRQIRKAPAKSGVRQVNYQVDPWILTLPVCTRGAD
ncbi:unnamed protein product [Clonostachys rosea]|uniref:Uncharacterized protein n=1 Tax=Bionectria ochroleuca TaxID=29856 RepID=A0ABY6V063_BIOOC|nr:unnamed protein product [Clonostachys rosea]